MIIEKNSEVQQALFQYLSAACTNNILERSRMCCIGMSSVDIPAFWKKVDTFRKKLRREGTALSKNEAIVALALELAYDQVAPTKEEQTLLPVRIRLATVARSKVFRNEKPENNPYLELVALPNDVPCGKYRLQMIQQKRYSFFLYQSPLITKEELSIPSYGIADHDFRYPAFVQDDEIAFAVDPYLMNTTLPFIQNASGEVLILGAAMGYVPFMIGLKTDIEHVTVVEADTSLITFFQNCVLPKCPHPERFTIINENPANYIGGIRDGQYDYCFVQLWSSGRDIVPYINMKRLCRRFEQTKIMYWDEAPLSHMISLYIMDQMASEIFGSPLHETDEEKIKLVQDLVCGEHVQTASDVKRVLSHNAIAQVV